MNLTRRERTLYRCIVWFSGGVWVFVLLAYFIIGDLAARASILEASLFGLNTIVLYGFS